MGRARNAVLAVLLLSLASPAQAAKLQDPLRPVKYAAPATASSAAVEKRQGDPPKQLEAILFSAARSVAVVDGQAMQVGDSIDGYRLTRIERGQVVLQKKKQRLVLRRNGTGLKKVSAGDVSNSKGSRQ